MAKRKVLEVCCDRCKKVDIQPDDGTEQPGPALEMSLYGQKVVFTDLCRRCKKTLAGSFKSVAYQDEETKPEATEPTAQMTPVKKLLIPRV